VEHRFTITPHVVGSQSKGIPRPGVFVQRAWIPRWVPTAIPVAAAAAAAVLLLLPKQATVPSLIGAVGIEDATARLQKAGLAFGQAESVPTGKFKVGTVLRQSMPVGQRVKRGTPISVVIAAASELGLVPNIAGLPLAEGEKALQKAGFVPGTVVPAPTDPNEAILSQSLPGGQRAHLGSVVNIFLPKPVTTSTTASTSVAATAPSAAGGAAKLLVPSVAGLTGAAITAAIAKLGLTPVPVTQFSASVPMGRVVSQTPPAGAPPPADGKVTIVVSGGFPDLAYDNGADVFVVGGAAGKPVKPVANSPDLEADPAWSPDGTLLAYLHGNTQQKQAQIVVADPAKPGSAHAVTNAGFFDHRPAFSPDGKVIAFVRTASNGDGDLCFVPADGSAPPNCKVDPTTSVNRPAWAPDGKAILVTATTTGSSNAELYEYTSAAPSSSDPNAWQPQGFVSQTSVFQAAWSADGKQVAYTASTGSGYFVFVAPAANDVVGQPNALGVRGCDVAWRPDGVELAVVQADAGCTQLGKLVRLDIRSQKTTPVANNAADPAWSPVGH
jgi:beta-lactam-binding protein with PASTA domain